MRTLNKDFKIRKLFNKFEKKRFLIKSLIYTPLIHLYQRYALTTLFYHFTKNSSIARIKNKCLFSGRSRGIISKYKLSRHMLKQFINTGNIYLKKKK